MSVHNPIAHILYENADWLPPLVAGLEAEGFSVRLVELTTGLLEGGSVPAEGIWINRVSPSFIPVATRIPSNLLGMSFTGSNFMDAVSSMVWTRMSLR